MEINFKLHYILHSSCQNILFISSVKQDTLQHEKKISYTTDAEHLISLKVKVIFIISEEQLVAQLSPTVNTQTSHAKQIKLHHFI